MENLGERFVDAIARRDAGAIRAVLADDVDFKGLTPGRLWEASSSSEVIDVVFGSWFEDSDHVDEVREVTTGLVADTHRVGYRLAVTTPEGPHLVEQQAYYRVDGDRIGHLRVVCSGFRPVQA